MVMGLLSTLALGAVLMTAPATDMGGDAATRSVTVRLHDYAKLDAALLRVTEEQVSAIYAAIGVVVIWRMPVRPNDVRDGLSPWPSDPAPELTMLLMSTAMAAAVGIKDGVAGFAAVGASGGGSVAFTVPDRTRRIADCAGLPHTIVLASVIAHELGHLLMSTRGHSSSGIMRPQWTPSEFRDRRQSAFAADEANSIRRTVERLRFASTAANH